MQVDLIVGKVCRVYLIVGRVFRTDLINTSCKTVWTSGLVSLESHTALVVPLSSSIVPERAWLLKKCDPQSTFGLRVRGVRVSKEQGWGGICSSAWYGTTDTNRSALLDNSDGKTISLRGGWLLYDASGACPMTWGTIFSIEHHPNLILEVLEEVAVKIMCRMDTLTKNCSIRNKLCWGHQYIGAHV